MSNVAAGKDTDDEGETLNDVEKTLNSYGIALRNSKKEWRSFEEVLDEVAEKWKTFSGTEQSHIATAFAGTRQIENFRAMMSNWDEVTRLTLVAADSTGSATERMGTYLDSIEAKTNNVKAAWEQFVMSLSQNESFKQMLDILASFLEKLSYVDWNKVLSMLGNVLKIFLAFKGVQFFGGIGSDIAGLITRIKELKTITGGLSKASALGGILGTVGKIGGTLSIVLGIVQAIYSVYKQIKESTEVNLKDVEDRKKALDEEESSVKKLYQRYSELEGKSK